MAEPQLSETLFSGKYYSLSWGPCDNAIGTIVTFNTMRDDFQPDVTAPYFAPPFGEGLFVPEGIQEFHVVSNSNDWFQHEEIFSVLEKIRTVAVGKTVFYGSSMGGFAAANLSYYLDADFIAFSPQSTLDPASYPYDHAWSYFFETIPCQMNNLEKGLCSKGKGLVFSDSKHIDFLHAQKIQSATAAHVVDVPYSGHETLAAVNAVLSVKKMIAAYIHSTPDVHSLQENIESLTLASPLHNVNRATWLASGGETEAALGVFSATDVSDPGLNLYRNIHELCVTLDEKNRRHVASRYAAENILKDVLLATANDVATHAPNKLYFCVKILEYSGSQRADLIPLLGIAIAKNPGMAHIVRYCAELRSFSPVKMFLKRLGRKLKRGFSWHPH